MSAIKDETPIVLGLENLTITVRKTSRFIFLEQENHISGAIYSETIKLENIQRICILINKDFQTTGSYDRCAIMVYTENSLKDFQFKSSSKDIDQGIDFRKAYEIIIKNDKQRTDFVLQMKILFELI